MLRVLACCLCLMIPALVQADPTFLWSDAFDGGGLYDDTGEIVTFAPDGNVVVAGASHDGIDGSDMLIRMLNRTTGAEIWSRRIPAFDTSDMAVTGVGWDAAENLIIGGHILGCVG
jgi:hypothetical protein